MPGRLRRRWVWLAIAAVIVVGVGLAAFLVAATLFKDTSTPLDVDDAVEDFRRDGEVPGAIEGLPEPGVYVYVTEGGEEVDALSGTRHDYPAETTVTVSVTGCGVALRWDVLAERYESWQLCRKGVDLTQPGYVSFHRFFGQPDMKSFVCSEGTLALAADPAPGQSWQADCSAGSLHELTAFEVIGIEELAVGDVEVPSVHLRFTTEVDGSSTGSSEGHVWLDPATGLTLRWQENVSTSSRSAIGAVQYTESFTIQLAGIEPRR